MLAEHNLVILAERPDAFLEVVKVLRERRDDEREERLVIFQRRGELVQAVLDVLRVVRRERGPRAHLRHWCGRLERPKPEGVAEEHELPLSFGAPRLAAGVGTEKRAEQTRARVLRQRRRGRRGDVTQVLRVSQHVRADGVQQRAVQLRDAVLALVVRAGPTAVLLERERAQLAHGEEHVVKRRRQTFAVRGQILRRLQRVPTPIAAAAPPEPAAASAGPTPRCRSRVVLIVVILVVAR
mmetsp:Transcript_11849/g.49650  ORF Transcript_11849/g.49650 Transcript_11849/m.49650 type:complete len:239 (-) Transcript_11849:1099-1815(-)